jgi:anti-sigma-K factor RskA
MQKMRSEGAATTSQVPSPTRPPVPVWICAAVAAALLFALYNAYEARTTNATIQRTRDALEEQIHMQQVTARELAVARREALILTDPKSLKIAMLAGKKGLPMLRATWNPGLGLVISGQKLQNPSVNRTLQLWLIPKAAEAKPVPSLTLRPRADGNFDLLVANPPDSPGATKALAITDEPEGGSPQPTTPPIWTGAVANK